MTISPCSWTREENTEGWRSCSKRDKLREGSARDAGLTQRWVRDGLGRSASASHAVPGIPGHRSPGPGRGVRGTQRQGRGYSHCCWEQGTFPSSTGLKDLATTVCANGWSSMCRLMSVGRLGLRQEHAGLPGLLTVLILQTEQKKIKKCCRRI